MSEYWRSTQRRREKRYQHNCEQCYRRFNATREDARYCSNACRMAASRERTAQQKRYKLPANKSTLITDQPANSRTIKADTDWKPTAQQEALKRLVSINGQQVYCYPVLTSSGQYTSMNGKPEYLLFCTSTGQTIAVKFNQVQAAQARQAVGTIQKPLGVNDDPTSKPTAKREHNKSDQPNNLMERLFRSKR